MHATIRRACAARGVRPVRGDDVPIDLGTRRMLIYGDAVEGGLEQKLDQGIQEVLTEYGWDLET